VSLCVFSGLYTIGIVFLIVGWVLKTLLGPSSKYAYYVGVGLFLAGGSLVAPTMFMKNWVVGIVLCLAILGTSYGDYTRYRRSNPPK